MPAVLEQRKIALQQIAFVLASALTFVWGHRLLPLQDFPDWLTQGRLFSDLLRGALAHEYAFKGIVPVPNAAATVGIGILSLWFPPETAGKLVLSGYLVGYVCCVVYLFRANGRLPGLIVLAASLVLTFNYSFFHGELNYALGLVGLFAAQAMLLRAGARPSRRVLVVAGLATLLIYGCHGATYAAWLMFLTAYAWTSGSAYTRVALLLAVIPSLILAALYTLSLTSQPAPIVVGFHPHAIVAAFGDKLWLIFKFLCPFQAFYPYVNPQCAWLLIAGNVVTLALATWAFIHWFRLRAGSRAPSDRTLRACLLIYAAAFVLAPENLGGLLNPAERLVIPAYQLVLVLVASTSRLAPPHRLSWKLSWSVLAMQAMYLHLYAGFVSGQLATTHSRLLGLAQSADLSVVHESHFRFQGHPHPARPWFWCALPMHYPLLRVTYYAKLEARRPVPIFETGLFRNAATYVHNSADSIARVASDRPIAIVGWPPGSRAVRALLPATLIELATDNRSFIVLGPAD